MIDKNKMHRAIQIKTGKVKWVSPRLASKPDMLLDYGMMLQEFPEENKIENVFLKHPVTGEEVEFSIEKTEDGFEYKEVTFEFEPFPENFDFQKEIKKVLKKVKK